MFFYLPLIHSENLADQADATRLVHALLEATGDTAEQHAHNHHDVIRRFGRFPHRNAILGRVSTPEEEEYLAQPGAGFGPRDKEADAMNDLADRDHEIGSGDTAIVSAAIGRNRHAGGISATPVPPVRRRPA